MSKYKIILPVPKVKSISLGGGGARGCVYGPVLEELERTKVLKEIGDVLGVSAGSITSSLLAIGAASSEITHIAQDTNFKQLLGPFSLFSGDGLGLFRTNTLKKVVEENLKIQFDLRIAELKGFYAHVGYTQEEIDKLQNKPLTFATLEQLRQLYVKIGQPDRIKSLSILAVDNSDATPYLFSYSSNQDVLIADAVVASSAIPPVFQPHSIEMNGTKKKFIDGGMHRSLLTPEYQIPKFVTNKERRLDSIFLWLASEEEANQKLYGPTKPLFIMVFVGWLIKMIFGANGVQAKFGMEQGAKEYGQGVIPMNVDISPNDFGVSQEKKKALGEKSVHSVREYFKNFRDGASYVIEGESLKECLYEVPFAQLDDAIQHIGEKMEDKGVAEEVKAHRVLQEMSYSKTILAKLAQPPRDLKILDEETFATYCNAPLSEIDSAQSKRIYDINMERILNGSSHLLATFFTQYEIDPTNCPNLYTLKEQYQSMLNTSAPYLIP